MKDSAYWKAYRLKHCDKLKDREKLRSAKRRIAKRTPQMTQEPLEVSTPTQPQPQTPRQCQADYCTNIGHEVLVHGMKAWLCSSHS